jgi:hypothetical protein
VTPGDEHFVARTRHLLDLVARYPAPSNDPWFKVNGVQFWPATPISTDAIALMETERAPFDRGQRDNALKCGYPATLPENTQVVLLEARGGRLAVPVFLQPDGGELHYLELSLDAPGAPVLLVITGYDGLAVRITKSAATRIAAVHLNTYYPNAVLGIEPALVTQQYLGRERASSCKYGFSDAVQGPAVIRQLGFDPAKAVRYRAGDGSLVAIGTPQSVQRQSPKLGAFLDPMMPLPHNYGVVVLASLGYIRPVAVKPAESERLLSGNAFEVLKPFRIPEGLAGSHSVTFVLTNDSPVPAGNLGHSSLLRRIR